MAVVFDYSERLDASAVNVRPRADMALLLHSQLWKIQGAKDGSDNLLYTELCKNGAGAADLHVVCPPYCAYKATNSHLFGGKQYFIEWLIVSCRGDCYVVVLHTKRLPGGLLVSEIDHISRKNPTLEVEERTWEIRPLIQHWLEQCALQADLDDRPAAVKQTRPA